METHTAPFFLRVYLFIRKRERGRERERERERSRDTGRGRSRLHAGSPKWDSWDSRIAPWAKGRR